MAESHLSDGDLERYVTGMIAHDAAVKWVEDHLYACPVCAARMMAIQDHMDDPGSSSLETDTPGLYRGDGPLQ